MEFHNHQIRVQSKIIPTYHDIVAICFKMKVSIETFTVDSV